jgi:hypothetical protein
MSESSSLEVAAAISKHRDALVGVMMETADRTLPTSEPEVRQFLVGFLGLMQAAAGGDTGPRDEYLEAVIPAVRASGINLSVVVSAMPRLAVAIGAVLGPGHAPWTANFIGDYTTRILEHWGQP